MTQHVRNLVFEGGGVKGIAYVGALEVLKSSGILKNITRVGGASAGAIISVMVGLKYSNEDISKIMGVLDFNKFTDTTWPLGDIRRLWKKFGWYKGDYFREWIGEIIKTKTGSSETTFAEAKESGEFLDMYFIGANLSTGFGRVFSAEHTSGEKIADAVRISMSIPLFFAAKRLSNDDLYVDGGLLNNYPVKLFDRKNYVDIDENFAEPGYYEEHNKGLSEEKPNSKYVYNKETLGFRLDSAKEIAVFRDDEEPIHNKIKSFPDYAKALIGAIVENQDSMHLHSDDWHRTVYIDTLDVSGIDFNLSDKKKDELIKSGRKSMTDYISWYENPPEVKPRDKTPLNKPS
jgi:NTE family protein